MLCKKKHDNRQSYPVALRGTRLQDPRCSRFLWKEIALPHSARRATRPTQGSSGRTRSRAGGGARFRHRLGPLKLSPLTPTECHYNAAYLADLQPFIGGRWRGHGQEYGWFVGARQEGAARRGSSEAARLSRLLLMLLMTLCKRLADHAVPPPTACSRSRSRCQGLCAGHGGQRRGPSGGTYGRGGTGGGAEVNGKQVDKKEPESARVHLPRM